MLGDNAPVLVALVDDLGQLAQDRDQIGARFELALIETLEQVLIGGELPAQQAGIAHSLSVRTELFAHSVARHLEQLLQELAVSTARFE